MGHAIRILGLSPDTRRLFRRALALSGAGSQSRWISAKIRQLIREQQERHGDLMQALTEDEHDLIEVIRSGAAEIQHIVVESLLSEKQVEAMLADLIKRGLIEERKKGGKTAQARGAVITMYFVKE